MPWGFFIVSIWLISIFSSNKYVAGINTAIYGYTNIITIEICRKIILVKMGYGLNPLLESIPEYLTYGIVLALIFFIPGFIIWHSRIDKLLFKMLRYLPVVGIIIELVFTFNSFLINKLYLPVLIIDSLLLTIYIILVLKKKKEKNVSDDIEWKE